MANTASAVWVEVLPSMAGFGTALAQQAAGAGTRTGDKIGAELEKAAGEAGKRAGDAMATGVEAAVKRVDAAASSVAAARNKEADAAGKVRVAEQKLEEARAGGKSGSVIAAAEEKLAAARRGLETATAKSIKSAHDLEIAEHDAAQATNEVATASDRAADRTSGFGSGLADIGKKAAGFAIGMIAVSGGMDLFQKALTNTDLAANLQAKLGTTPAMAAQYGQIAGELYASNYGESLSAVSDAIGDVVRSGALMEDATSEQIKTITGEALNLAQVFGEDVPKVMRSIGIMMRTGMAPDAQSAMDIVTRGFQQGVNIADDFLDTLNEYSIQFQKLGLDGATATGLLSQGLKAGARDADTVADALKEFSIRALDGSKSTIEGFKALGLNASDMADQIGRGGQDASAGLQTVLDGLRGIEDPVARSQAAVALFGTKAEDLGQALYALDPSSAVGALGTVGGAAQAMSDTLASSPAAALATFGREVQTWIVDLLGGKVIPIVGQVATFLRDNFGPAVSAGSAALAEFGGWVQRNSDWLIPLSLAIGGFVIGYAAVSAATSLWAAKTVILTAAQWLLNTALSANPIGLIVGLIVGLVAAFVWLWNNNEGFREFWIDLWDKIKSAAMAVWTGFLKPVLDAIVTAFHWVVDAAVTVGQAFADAWSAVSSALSTAWSVVEPILAAIGTVLAVIGAVLFTVLVTPFVIAFNLISAVVTFFWTNVLSPVFGFIGDIFTWIWVNVISVYIGLIVDGFHLFADVALWLYDVGIKPAFDLIGIAFDAVGAVVSWVIDQIVGSVRLWVDIVVWLYTQVVQYLDLAGKMFGILWDTYVSPVIEAIKTALSQLGDVFVWIYENVIKPIWDALGSLIRAVYDQWIQPAFTAISDALGVVGKSFEDGVGFIEKVWSKIKEIAAVPVNFVIDTVYNNGIRKVWNWVAGFVGLDELAPIDTIKFAGGGVLGGYAPGRDIIPALLSPGESVLTPEATRLVGPGNILALNAAASGRPASSGSSRGIRRFAGGGIVSDLLSFIPGIGDDVSALWTDPAGFISSRIGGGSNWLRGLAEMPSELLAKGAQWLWDKLMTVFSSSSATGDVSGDLAAWIGAAIAFTGVGADWFGPLSTLIMRESGGNPNAINLWDSNAQAGYPSQGLMQTIPQTFAAYRDPRLPNSITDPIANIVAGINYIKARYGSIFNVQQAVGSTPLGYDEGGYLPPGVSTVFNGTGRPEPVLTGPQWTALSEQSNGEPVAITGTLAVADDGLNVFVTGHIVSANHATGTAVINRRR